MKADRLTGLGMLPLSFTDLSTMEVKFWPQAWVSVEPGTGRAKEDTDVQWTLHTGQEAA